MCPTRARRPVGATSTQAGLVLERCTSIHPFLREGVNSDLRGISHIHFLRLCLTGALAATLSVQAGTTTSDQQTLTDARAAFYNASFEKAGALTLDLCAADDLDACELRTAALLMEIKRAIGDSKDKDKALKACAKCQGLLDAFLQDTSRGQAAARARLKADPSDEAAQFLLGKLDLNYVWLQLGTLGRKTGWNEYWEARRTLDAILKKNPQNVRAKVARAWIDYIVATRTPRGTRWVLGGGNKKRAIAALREAAQAGTDVYTSAEARFGLWDVLVREKQFPEAIAVARELASDFPQNTDLPKFLEAHDPASKPRQ
jgi:tetratricopeptide (TPR) repeat protein